MANESGIGLEYPIRVMGGDGTVLWSGCGFPGNIIRAQNYGTVALTVGMAVVFAQGTQMVPNAAASATRVQQTLRVRAANTTGAFNAVFAGVVLTPAAACSTAGDTLGGLVVIAGPGSVVPVRSLTTGSLTNNVAGAYTVASTTDGSVQVTYTLPTVPVGALGKVIPGGISGTTGGATDSGSATIVITTVALG